MASDEASQSITMALVTHHIASLRQMVASQPHPHRPLCDVRLLDACKQCVKLLCCLRDHDDSELWSAALTHGLDFQQVDTSTLVPVVTLTVHM